MKKKYNNWILSVVSLSILLLASIALLNYFVNPYNIFNSPTINGLNEQKIESKEYLIKKKDLVNQQPHTLFLGSSRTHHGLDPSYYEEITNTQAYNLGLASATMEIQLRYLEYELKNNPSLKRVIIGLDFEAFNKFGVTPSIFDEKRLQTKWWPKDDLLANLLTVQALLDSKQVLLENFLQVSNLTKNLFLEDGSINEVIQLKNFQDRLDNGDNPFYEHLQWYLGNEQMLAKYEVSNKSISYFQDIVDLCKEHQIELIPFIQPTHALQWTGIEMTGHWSQLEQWKKDIIQIVPVWDFSGYNSITTTSHENFDVYFDQSHYRKKIGDLILNKILQLNTEQVPADFGVYLTEDNIHAHLLNIQKDRDMWMENNPHTVEKIREMVVD